MGAYVIYVIACILRSEDNLQDLVFLFYHVVLRIDLKSSVMNENAFPS